jgi:hypothetical protein
VLGLVLLLLRSRALCVGVWRWVEHKGWFMDVGTLLGPEGTPFVVFLLAPGLDRLTHRVVGVVVVVVGWGVVVR